MSHISLVVGVFVLASGVWQQPPPVAAQDSGRLRWVRGAVIDVSPASKAASRCCSEAAG